LTLVGPGRAGRALARSWTGSGGLLSRVIVRDRIRVSPSAFPQAEIAEADLLNASDCDLLAIAVPDDAIASCAERLAERLRPRFAFHLSGALGSELLAPFAREGALIASMHPLRPFTGADGEDWRDAFVAVEGDEAACRMADALARSIGARPHRIAAAEKALYHAAASLAAGGVAGVLSVAARQWVRAGIAEPLAREALAGLAARAIGAAGARSFEEALTGAVARRDAGTVRRHVRALAFDERALELYRILAEEILHRTPGRGRESEILEILGLADEARINGRGRP